MNTRICNLCGRTFHTRHASQKFCDDECKLAAEMDNNLSERALNILEVAYVNPDGIRLKSKTVVLMTERRIPLLVANEQGLVEITERGRFVWEAYAII